MPKQPSVELTPARPSMAGRKLHNEQARYACCFALQADFYRDAILNILMDFKKNPDTDFKNIDDLNEDEAAGEAAALREGINYHDHLYYVKDAPRISDAKYDKLLKRLEDLEDAHPKLKTDDSPTQRVGAEPVSELEKVEHSAPLLSLQATLEADAVKRLLDRAREAADSRSTDLVLEPKFDGLSVEVIYREGKFERGATRGNGRVGEDISRNLKTVHTLPLSLQGDELPDRLAVRGEVYMPLDGFTRLNKQRVESGRNPFANPRNAAAGLMRQYESRNVAGKPLAIFFYEILAADGDLPDSHEKVLRQLRDWGLRVTPLNKTASSFKEIEKYHRKLVGRRDDLDYEIDGIVIKVDDRELRETLGTRDRNPRWALAWKFEPREESTLVEDIVVQVGRTGILTPVALLQPVDVGGVTVSRATLHNEREARRKDIRIGDRVKIIRAGDVIPEIAERIKRPGRKRGDRFEMPGQCPVCDAAITREGAYHIYSAGLACPAQLRGRIRHFASREAMDIDHLGEDAADQLVTRGLVENLADLYQLKKNDLESLEGYAEKSAGKLHDAIQDAKSARLDRFLYALGIAHVGHRVARQLAGEFGTLDRLMKADRERLQKIPDIGAEIAAATADFFADKDNRRILQRLHRAGLEIGEMPARDSQPLKGKTFVFSGALHDFTRSEAREQVEALGGRATSSISGETDYLVLGDSPGSKRDEAEEQGVDCIDEDAFKRLLER
ncbi:NAD-dependent DNA ligase LigA [Microbulbifer halophilus]|uniref:DNA ligase n=1 Tax=Microbulbifer halophilus TaxID=453963 RepID=A0ABW5EFF7_9GAMM|nr:NAD-dependent DNA ligase LigA [Microbulbifer halophilus]MCW8126535.1 NAD-dependent DNA ligase LigA [Microbulbifer halophilus]